MSQDNQKWSYAQDYLWKNPGCTGSKQSPINIDTSQLQRCGVLCDLKLYLKPEKPSVEFTSQNDVILSFVSSQSSITFNNRYFNLKSIRIHVPSLHTIDNSKADMEVVCLFDSGSNNESSSNNSLQNVAKGVQLCFMMNQSDNEYGNIEQFFNQFIHKIPTVQDELPIELNVSNTWSPELLIPNKKNFYYYEGSLAYPPCSEMYINIVYEEIGNIGVNNFRTLKKYIRNNTRALKPKNNRIVYYSVDESKSASIQSNSIDRISDNRFLQCEKQNNVVQTNENVTISSTVTENNRVIQLNTAKKIRDRLLFIIIVLLFFLAYQKF